MDSSLPPSQRNLHDTRFGPYRLHGETLQLPGGQKHPAFLCSGEVATAGADGSRLSATRVGLGAVALGPLGALLGGLAQKKTAGSWLIITTPSGPVTTPLKGPQVVAAQKFLEKLDAVKARHAETGGVTSETRELQARIDAGTYCAGCSFCAAPKGSTDAQAKFLIGAALTGGAVLLTEAGQEVCPSCGHRMWKNAHEPV